MKINSVIKFFILFIFPILMAFGCVNDDLENEETNKPIDETKEIVYSQEKVNVSELTLLDSFIYDFDKDEVDEEISLYTSAQKDSNGEIMWDDGQIFKLIVHDENKDYVIFDEYVQLGKVDYYVYIENEIFTITVLSPRTASFTVTDYFYDETSNGFIKEKVIEKISDVNMLKK